MVKRRTSGKAKAADSRKTSIGCAAVLVFLVIASIVGQNSDKRTPSPTRTPRPTAAIVTASPANTPRPTAVAASQSVTFYVVGSVVGKSCPEVTCETIANFSDGESLEVIANDQGEAVNGDTLWRVVIVNGRHVYIHNSGVVWGGAYNGLKRSVQSTDTPRAVSQTTASAQPHTPRPTNTLRPAVETVTYYTLNTARLRSCPRLTASCENTSVSGGTALQAISDIQGAEFNGSTLWYIVDYQGERLYVHSALVSRNRPAPVVPTQPQSQAPIMQSTPPPAQQAWSCQGDQYNCDDFTTCAAAKDYFAACPGDPSRLDGNNDGIPCNARGYVCG